MKYVLQYSKLAKELDYPKLGGFEKNRIKDVVENKLTSYPEIYGKPLRGSLKGYRSLRVGGYRVVFAIENKCVSILAIMKRDIVYKEVRKRLRVIVL